MKKTNKEWLRATKPLIKKIFKRRLWMHWHLPSSMTSSINIFGIGYLFWFCGRAFNLAGGGGGGRGSDPPTQQQEEEQEQPAPPTRHPAALRHCSVTKSKDIFWKKTTSRIPRKRPKLALYWPPVSGREGYWAGTEKRRPSPLRKGIKNKGCSMHHNLSLYGFVCVSW